MPTATKDLRFAPSFPLRTDGFRQSSPVLSSGVLWLSDWGVITDL